MVTSALEDNELAPVEWLESNVPTTTVSGVRMAYVESETSYRRRYYSIDWLAEEFRSQIEQSSDPQRALVQACEQRGYGTLKSLFADRRT